MTTKNIVPTCVYSFNFVFYGSFSNENWNIASNSFRVYSTHVSIETIDNDIQK